MTLFDSHATFVESMPAKSLALLPFLSSSHSAAAACNACERTRRGGRQYGATGLCHRSRCSRRHGSCSFLCCSRSRFEFSCRHNRSDADSTATVPLGTLAIVLMQRVSLLCMLLCRSGAGVEWGLSTPSVQRRAALRAVRTTAESLQGKAACAWIWSHLSWMLHGAASSASRCSSAAAPEATLRHSAVDAAVEAKEGSACRSC